MAVMYTFRNTSRTTILVSEVNYNIGGSYYIQNNILYIHSLC